MVCFQSIAFDAAKARTTSSSCNVRGFQKFQARSLEQRPVASDEKGYGAQILCAHESLPNLGFFRICAHDAHLMRYCPSLLPDRDCESSSVRVGCRTCPPFGPVARPVFPIWLCPRLFPSVFLSTSIPSLFSPSLSFFSTFSRKMSPNLGGSKRESGTARVLGSGTSGQSAGPARPSSPSCSLSRPGSRRLTLWTVSYSQVSLSSWSSTLLTRSPSDS